MKFQQNFKDLNKTEVSAQKRMKKAASAYRGSSDLNLSTGAVQDELNILASATWNLEGVIFKDLPILIQKFILLTGYVAVFIEDWKKKNIFGKIGLLLGSAGKAISVLESCLSDIFEPNTDQEN